MRQNYLSSPDLDTIYVGGGTPSLLNKSSLQRMFSTVHQLFSVSNNAEITLEANPDDLNKSKLEMLLSIGFNRLSIGVQSFQDGTLRFLNRLHDSDQALRCVHQAREEGFANISLDLIYGIPDQPENRWEMDLKKA